MYAIPKNHLTAARWSTSLLGAIALLTVMTTGLVAAQSASAGPSAAMYFVDPAGNNANTCQGAGPANACKSISAALTKATPAIVADAVDVTVNLAAGNYSETFTIPAGGPGHTHVVNIAGAGAASTTISGNGVNNTVVHTAGGIVNLSGMTITGGGPSNNAYAGGIDNDADTTLTLTDSIVQATWDLTAAESRTAAP